MGLTRLAFLWVVGFALVVTGTLAVNLYNVVDSGAIGDGITDDKNVFLDIWEKACLDPCSPTMLIPSGKTFLLSPVKFRGPCSSPIHFQVDGNITAPNKIWLDETPHWIEFSGIDGLVIDGEGLINGNGEPWWQYKLKHGCFPRPDVLGVIHSTNVTLRNLRFIDSPKKHIGINSTDNVCISNLTITAPGTSPNTDGIHLESSRHIEITDLIIGTGDDCISIGNGTFDVNITRIICGPGHGISVGSLGRDNTEANVGQIHVSDCNLYNTTNGLRIKTWQVDIQSNIAFERVETPPILLFFHGRNSGSAKDITFDRINFTLVERPIIIDQFYCDKQCHHCPDEKSDLQVSKISYTGLTRTGMGPVAISLNCNPTIGCVGISMKDVDIRAADGETMEAFCINAHVVMADRVNPPVRCVY